MSIVISYLRCSTVDQNLERQRVLIQDYCSKHNLLIHREFFDQTSGKNTNRPQFQEMILFLREGDTLIVESYSRLSRNTADFYSLLDDFQKRKINFISIKENFDFSTATGKLFANFAISMATFERELLLERQKEGIALAKANGKYKGRKPILMPPSFPLLFQKYQMANKKHPYSLALFQKESGLSRNIFFKFLKILRANPDDFIIAFDDDLF